MEARRHGAHAVRAAERRGLVQERGGTARIMEARRLCIDDLRGRERAAQRVRVVQLQGLEAALFAEQERLLHLLHRARRFGFVLHRAGSKTEKIDLDPFVCCVPSITEMLQGNVSTFPFARQKVCRLASLIVPSRNAAAYRSSQWQR